MTAQNPFSSHELNNNPNEEDSSSSSDFEVMCSADYVPSGELPPPNVITDPFKQSWNDIK
jgi:hypothetical protein